MGIACAYASLGGGPFGGGGVGITAVLHPYAWLKCSVWSRFVPPGMGALSVAIGAERCGGGLAVAAPAPVHPGGGPRGGGGAPRGTTASALGLAFAFCATELAEALDAAKALRCRLTSPLAAFSFALARLSLAVVRLMTSKNSHPPILMFEAWSHVLKSAQKFIHRHSSCPVCGSFISTKPDANTQYARPEIQAHIPPRPASRRSVRPRHSAAFCR